MEILFILQLVVTEKRESYSSDYRSQNMRETPLTLQIIHPIVISYIVNIRESSMIEPWFSHEKIRDSGSFTEYFV